MNRACGCGSIAIGFALFPILLACGNRQQSKALTIQKAPEEDPSFYASFYIGRRVSDPEALSGIWEARDGRGGAVGIDLQLITYLPRDARSFEATNETWQTLQVGVYERALAATKLGEENYFTDSRQGGDVRYENGHLTLHSGPFDLDLVRLPGQRWSGRLHRNDFDAQVLLTRSCDCANKNVGFVGTWRRDSGAGTFACLHIAQPARGEFTAWEDSHQVPGRMRFAPGLQRPATATQIYGEMTVARSMPEGNLLLLESPASLPACCPHSSLATLTKHGMQLILLPVPPILDLNDIPAVSAKTSASFHDGAGWRKMPGPNCIAPNRPAH
jgi:hypothetical protein